MRLFDIKNNTSFCFNIYSADQPISYVQAGWILAPSTLDESFRHPGGGELPAIKTAAGSWDLRPHRQRLAVRDKEHLATDALFFGDPDPESTRCLTGVLALDLESVDRILRTARRLTVAAYTYERGVEPKPVVKTGLLAEMQCRSNAASGQVLMAGSLGVGTPFAQEPHEPFRSNRDFDEIDLEALKPHFVPRSNYTIIDRDSLLAHFSASHKGFTPNNWRLVWRRRIDVSGERVLQAALVPPGPINTNSVAAVTFFEPSDLVELAALWCSLPVEFLVRMTGKDDLQENLAQLLPGPARHELSRGVGLRALRLNCLTLDYAPLWSEVHDPSWCTDEWALPHATVELNDIGPEWTMATPLRRDVDRRQALVEIDALAALILGLTSEQLCAMFRTQFPVLRKYEYSMVFDTEGRKICKHHQSAGHRQSQLQERAKAGNLPAAWKSIWALVQQEVDEPGSVDWLGHYTPPFYRPDRETEMTAAYREFQRRLDAGQYQKPTAWERR